ncbi:hypothetical protein ACJX0J_033612, partial [Zea mays]
QKSIVHLIINNTIYGWPYYYLLPTCHFIIENDYLLSTITFDGNNMTFTASTLHISQIMKMTFHSFLMDLHWKLLLPSANTNHYYMYGGIYLGNKWPHMKDLIMRVLYVFLYKGFAMYNGLVFKDVPLYPSLDNQRLLQSAHLQGLELQLKNVPTLGLQVGQRGKDPKRLQMLEIFYEFFYIKNNFRLVFIYTISFVIKLYCFEISIALITNHLGTSCVQYKGYAVLASGNHYIGGV